VLGVLPGVIGVIQAIEAVKLIHRHRRSRLLGKMIAFDALKMKFREFKLRRDPKCPVCGENPTITELIDYDQFCGHPASEGAGRGRGARAAHQRAGFESKAGFEVTPSG
jgi:adenylyltransferase/sulfurtransferase